MRLIKSKSSGIWGTTNGSDSNCFKLVMLDYKCDRFILEAKPFNQIRILRIHGLRCRVNGFNFLMVVCIICAVIALGVLIEVLNK